MTSKLVPKPASVTSTAHLKQSTSMHKVFVLEGIMVWATSPLSAYFRLLLLLVALNQYMLSN
jgi:hypothetical protein